jgi:hypothetical protein
LIVTKNKIEMIDEERVFCFMFRDDSL